MAKLSDVVKSLLARKEFNLAAFDYTPKEFNLSLSSGLLAGYGLLHQVDLLLPSLPQPPTQLAVKLATALFDNCDRYCLLMDPRVHRCGGD